MSELHPGKVQTVNGWVDPNELGITHVHEHILHEAGQLFFHDHPTHPELGHEPISLENLWFVRNNVFNNVENTNYTDYDLACKEVARFAALGGETLVEVTTHGMGQQPEKMRRLSMDTGVKIVKGTAWYVQASHPAYIATESVNQLAARLVRDVTEGIDGTDVRAGVLGEMGISNPFHDDEKKALRAAVLAQQETGAPISIHPGMSDEVMLEILEVLRDAGADPERIIMGHLDAFGFTRETIQQVAEAGYYLAWDTFGKTEMMPAHFLGADLLQPSDGQRIADIRHFIDLGYLDKILVSQDTCFGTDLAEFGGGGYGHILSNVVPAMKRRGFTESEIDAMIVTNPPKVLAFTKVN